jgi:hypothetical protein
VHPGAESRRELSRDPAAHALRVVQSIDPDVLDELADWLHDHGPVQSAPGGPPDQERLRRWARMVRELP